MGDEPPNKRNKSLLTIETREDIDFLYQGFMFLFKFSITELKHGIVTSRINSDFIKTSFVNKDLYIMVVQDTLLIMNSDFGTGYYF